MRRFLAAAVLSSVALLAEAAERAGPPDDDPVASGTGGGPKTICSLIEEAAHTHDVPIDFFTRLIWKESRFRTAAVSPKGAQGIAQFMPATAARRNLSDPFDPEEAIPASAKYLSDLSGQFGNLGLAAAAYNAGEERVTDWLAGRSGLPWETRDYVLAITGRTAEEWSRPEPVIVAAVAPREKPVEGPADSDALKKPEPSCIEIAALLQKPGAGSELVASIPKAPWAPWGVQVAGNFSLNRAMASYETMQEKYPAILGGEAPMVLRSVMRSRGAAPMFQLRVPADDRDGANEICQRLRAAGGACVVFKN